MLVDVRPESVSPFPTQERRRSLLQVDIFHNGTFVLDVKQRWIRRYDFVVG